MTAVKYYSEAGKKAFVSISQEDYQSQGLGIYRAY